MIILSLFAKLLSSSFNFLREQGLNRTLLLTSKEEDELEMGAEEIRKQAELEFGCENVFSETEAQYIMIGVSIIRFDSGNIMLFDPK